jgi:Mg-chelatase subunit ChlD
MACGWGMPLAAALLLAAALSVSHAQKTEVVLILGDGCAVARMATHPLLAAAAWAPKPAPCNCPRRLSDIENTFIQTGLRAASQVPSPEVRG